MKNVMTTPEWLAMHEKEIIRKFKQREATKRYRQKQQEKKNGKSKQPK